MTQKHSSLRSPLSRARNLGAAKDGVGHWWWQRITAIVMAPLMVWFVYSLLSRVMGETREGVADWFASPLVTLAALVLLSAMFFHARLGVQVIVEDYVHQPAAKYALLIGNIIGFALLTVISWIAILKLHILGI